MLSFKDKLLKLWVMIYSERTVRKMLGIKIFVWKYLSKSINKYFNYSNNFRIIIIFLLTSTLRALNIIVKSFF